MCVPTIMLAVYSGFSQIEVITSAQKWLIDFIFTSLPVIVYIYTDLEFDQEALVRNHQLFSDGQDKLYFNPVTRLLWILSAALLGLAVFFVSFMPLQSAQMTFQLDSNSSVFDVRKEPSGRLPDIQVTQQAVMIGIVVAFNFKILSDSTSIEQTLVGSILMSVGYLLFICSKAEGSLFWDMWTFPVFCLVVLFFALAIWPVNQAIFYVRNQTNREELFEVVENNTYRKEKQQREQDEIDLEQRTEMLQSYMQDAQMRPSIS